MSALFEKHSVGNTVYGTSRFHHVYGTGRFHYLLFYCVNGLERGSRNIDCSQLLAQQRRSAGGLEQQSLFKYWCVFMETQRVQVGLHVFLLCEFLTHTHTCIHVHKKLWG